MSHRFFIGIGVAFFAILALGVAAVVGVSAMSDSANIASKPATIAPISAAPESVAETTPEPEQLRATPPSLRPNSPMQSSVIATGYTVQDSDIGQLAAAVKLGGPAMGVVGKEVWARETPVAEKLLEGLCDCDQRNWLNHFVETGHEAISGSGNYYQSIQLLATLRRSNADFARNQNFR
jgi:hypothetical protein